MRLTLNIIPVISVFYLVLGTNGVSIDKDLTLTASEKQILDQFKQEMLPSLPHDWMKEEIYLIRWLRAKEFNLPAAKELLYKNLEWRKENKIDEILSVDFGSFGKEYSHIFEGHDKENRPIIITNIGEWDVRKATTAGKDELLRKAMFHGFEKVSAMIRKLQDEGKSVTQYYHIYNLAGFNIYQHGCPRCISLVLDAVRTHDNHYPGGAHKIVLLNTPQSFVPILQTLRSVARHDLRDALEVLGSNRREWEAKLLEDIDKDQLVAEFGGTLVYDFDLNK